MAIECVVRHSENGLPGLLFCEPSHHPDGLATWNGESPSLGLLSHIIVRYFRSQ
jgi:hypothetical protein